MQLISARPRHLYTQINPVMNKIFTLSALFLFNLSLTKAQITVDNTTQSPADLVSNVLVGGGVTISNVKFNGSTALASSPHQSVGEFTGTSSIGLTNGVIIATGDAQLADGNNNSGGLTMGSTGGGGSDVDLNDLSGLPLFDQAVLEFDFVPSGDSIRFKYVFGSEEYLEWVGSGYNDVFGFFLSGPGISGPFSLGGINLATVPSTTTPISINTINNVTNAIYYVDNGTGSTPLINLHIQYDGFTVIMTAEAAVNCGDTYHIKLAISDAGDPALDSGVFLEAGSFSSDGVNVDLVTTSGTNTIMEGCLQGGTYTFTRPVSATGDTLTISVDVSGNAVNGVDYTPVIDSTITFLPGEDTVSFSFLAVADGVAETVDSLVITIYNINSCGDTIPSTATVYIIDLVPMVVDIGPDTNLACAGGAVPLTSTVTGGYTPYTYSWSTGGTGSSTSPTITVTQDIILVVNGPCGTTDSDTMHVDVAGSIPPVWTATNYTIVCPDSVEIGATWVSGGTAPFTYDWNTGETDSSHFVSPGTTTTYNLTITDVCGNDVTLNITVNASSIPHSWSLGPYDTYCPGDAITLSPSHISGGAAPYSYSWSAGGGTGSSATYSPFATTNYTVTITDVCGETTVVPVTVDVRIPTQIEVSISSDTLCIQDGSVTLVPIVANSNGSTVYTWTEGGVPISNASELTTTDLTTQSYVITVVDVCGSTDSDTSTVVIEACDITVPNIMTPNGDGYNEFWIITNLEKHPNTAVQVYNRWGQLMYENSAYQNNWDGGDVSDGVYFYVVTLTDGSTPANHHGTVQIARGK